MNSAAIFQLGNSQQSTVAPDSVCSLILESQSTNFFGRFASRQNQSRRGRRIRFNRGFCGGVFEVEVDVFSEELALSYT